MNNRISPSLRDLKIYWIESHHGLIVALTRCAKTDSKTFQGPFQPNVQGIVSVKVLTTNKIP